jgi:hypothetical protein
MQGWIHADLSTVQPQTFLPRVCKLDEGAETFTKVRDSLVGGEFSRFESTLPLQIHPM